MIDLQGETEASSLSGINDNPTLCMQSYIYIYTYLLIQSMVAALLLPFKMVQA